MKAKITYQVSCIPHPWDEKKRISGIKCYCLVKVVTPEFGPEQLDPVSIFNFDSEARIFMANVYAAGQEASLVKIDDDYRELCKRGIRS